LDTMFTTVNLVACSFNIPLVDIGLTGPALFEYLNSDASMDRFLTFLRTRYLIAVIPSSFWMQGTASAAMTLCSLRDANNGSITMIGGIRKYSDSIMVLIDVSSQMFRVTEIKHGPSEAASNVKGYDGSKTVRTWPHLKRAINIANVMPHPRIEAYKPVVQPPKSSWVLESRACQTDWFSRGNICPLTHFFYGHVPDIERVLVVARSSEYSNSAANRLLRVVENVPDMVGEILPPLQYGNITIDNVVGMVPSALVPRFYNRAMEPLVPERVSRGLRGVSSGIIFTDHIKAALLRQGQQQYRLMIMVGIDGFTCRFDRFRDFCLTQPRFFFIIRARFTDRAPLRCLPSLLSDNHSMGIFDSLDFRGIAPVRNQQIYDLLLLWVHLQDGKDASKSTIWRNRIL